MAGRPPAFRELEMSDVILPSAGEAGQQQVSRPHHRRISSLPDSESTAVELQGLLVHNGTLSKPMDDDDDDTDDDAQAQASRHAHGKGWWQRSAPSLWSGNGWWDKSLPSAGPRVWLLPDPMRHAAHAAGLLCVGLAVILAVSAGIVALAQHRGRGSGSNSYQYDGEPTASDSCWAGNPRTYCGDIGINKGDCEGQGCCWDQNKDYNKNVPSCFQPNTLQRMGQYKVVSKRTTELGYELQLEIRQRMFPGLGPDMERLTALVEAYTAERLHIKIAPAVSDVDNATPRWEVPQDLVPRPWRPVAPPDHPLYVISLPEPGDDFWVEVHRAPVPGVANDSLPVFSTKGFGLVFKDQFMQLTTYLDASSIVVGLGESTLTTGLVMPRDGKVITLWNTDTGAYNPEVNLYGSHPFFLELRQIGTSAGPGTPHAAAHGVFLLNSNGMDVELWKQHITYRVLGGVLDFAVMLGPDPESVIQQYHAVIGLPALPPRWALGYHQCRWGYQDVAALIDVVSKYQDANLPLDVIWSDIDYMQDYRVFTLDPVRYPEDLMNNFVQWLHSQGLHWVPIQDPGVQVNPSWPVWNQGVSQGVYIRDAAGNDPYIGQVWAGPSAWPDFFNPVAKQWWASNIATFRSMVPADGLWLDMNEVSNFCSGSCTLPRSWVVLMFRKFTRCATCCLLDCDTTPGNGPFNGPLDNPPYQINVQGHRAPLYTSTISPSARHSNGWVQFDTHNLYALSEAKATYETLAVQTQQRPFILSRASFPGLGRYAAHWTGDNAATWDNLRWSIAGMLSSNMWGIPLVGADICGFTGETNEDLCARWLEAGAFYTFSRNHADKKAPAHEAYLWAKTKLAAGVAFRLRYRLLPYLYTAFKQVEVAGGTVARPLFFEWPSDPEAVHASNTQWLLGGSVLVAPVLEEHDQGRSVYFPQGTWHRMGDGTPEQHSGPAHIAIDAPIGHPSVWGRSGTVLPLAALDATTTEQTFAAPLRLVVLLPSGGCNHTATSGGASGANGGGASRGGGTGGGGTGGGSGGGGGTGKGGGTGGGGGGAGGGSGGLGEDVVLARGEVYSDDGVGLPHAINVPGGYLHLEMTAGCWMSGGNVKGWLKFGPVTGGNAGDAAGTGPGGRRRQLERERGSGTAAGGGVRAGGKASGGAGLGGGAQREEGMTPGGAGLEGPLRESGDQAGAGRGARAAGKAHPQRRQLSQAFAPSHVLVSQVQVMGLPVLQQPEHEAGWNDGGPPAAPPPPPAPMPLVVLKLDAGRSERDGALSDELCGSEVVARVVDKGRMLVELSRPVPLMCLSQVVWEMVLQ